MIDLKQKAKDAFGNAKKRFPVYMKGDFPFEFLKLCAGKILNANRAYEEWGFISNQLPTCKTDERTKDCKKLIAQAKQNFSLKLADVIICCLAIAGAENIDMEKAILKSMEANDKEAAMLEVVRKTLKVTKVENENPKTVKKASGKKELCMVSTDGKEEKPAKAKKEKSLVKGKKSTLSK